MPRLYRDSPLNSIWEGSGNVAALDVLRAMVKEPDGPARVLRRVRAGARRERAPRRPPRLGQGRDRRARGRRRHADAGAARRRAARARAPGLAARAQRAAGGVGRVLRRPARRRGRPRLRHAARRASTRRRSSTARCPREHAPLREGRPRSRRITLDRPERGNGITLEMPRELAECVEQANLDPDVHVIALAGEGKGFCGGYDLGLERRSRRCPNHDPNEVWDPVLDWQMMSRNVRGFMSLFHSDKPVVCKVHGFCVAGGTDMALCSDLLVIADDARIGYPPARVWGVPTTMLWAHRIGAEKAKRMLFTGDLITGAQAKEWGLAIEAPPAAELDERVRGARRADREGAREPARDDEAARQPGALRAGPARDAGARHVLRRHRAPHEGGLRVPAARRGGRASSRPCASATSRSRCLRTLDVVRRVIDAINRADVDGVRSTRSADDFEIDFSNSRGPMSGIYRGRDRGARFPDRRSSSPGPRSSPRTRSSPTSRDDRVLQAGEIRTRGQGSGVGGERDAARRSGRSATA